MDHQFSRLRLIVFEIEKHGKYEGIKNEEVKIEKSSEITKSREPFKYIPTKHDEALQMNFSNRWKPKVISRKLGLPVNSIYRNIDQLKSFIQRLSRGETYTLKLNKDKF